MSIKIAHIANPVAGVGVYLELLIKYSDPTVFEHIVLGNHLNNDPGTQFKNRIDIPLIRPIHPLVDLRCLIKLIRALKELNPSLIHCHSAKAGILGRLAGRYLNIPTLYTPHAYSYLSASSNLKARVFKSIEKQFRFFNAKTLACSRSEQRRTIEELNFKKEKVLLWKNSIEGHSSIPSSTLDFELPDRYLCSVGRPSYQKNTLMLIEAIYLAKKTLNDINLILIGVGHYAPDLEKVLQLIEIRGLSDNITLVPWLNRVNVLNILKNCLGYISASRYEGLPFSVLEAMAFSKPCILTDVDGHHDLIENDIHGYLVPENPIEMAKRIVEFYQNPEKINDMGKESRSIVLKEHHIEKSIKSLENIYMNEVV